MQLIPFDYLNRNVCIMQALIISGLSGKCGTEDRLSPSVRGDLFSHHVSDAKDLSPPCQTFPWYELSKGHLIHAEVSPHHTSSLYR